MKNKIFTRIFALLFCASLVVTSLDSAVYADSAVESSQAEQTPEQSGSADGQSETDGQNVVDLQSESGSKDGSVLSTESNEKGGTEVAGTETNDTESETEKGTEKDTETEKTTEAENAEETTEEDKGAIDYEDLKSRIDVLPSVDDLESGKADAAETNEDLGSLVEKLYDYKLIDEEASEFALTEEATKELGEERVAKLKVLCDYFDEFSNTNAMTVSSDNGDEENNDAVSTEDVGKKLLGTSGMANPTAPESTESTWEGSYVYFGTYSGSPVKYRVLDSETTVFSSDNTTKTMLLNSDSVLWLGQFDNKDVNVWSTSYIKKYLNSEDRYGTNGFLTTAFTILEQSAIAESTKGTMYTGKDNNGTGSDGKGWENNLGYAALTGEKIFILDAVEATNESYGYSNTTDSSKNRVKKSATGSNFSSGEWWLRSPYTAYDQPVFVGYVGGAGWINKINADCLYAEGASPALNVNLSAVLFSTVVSGKVGETKTAYKLTLLEKESELNIAITNNEKVTRSRDTLTIPYTISGTNAGDATQVSVLITDKEYTTGNTNGAKVLSYGALDLGGNALETSGTGTYTLPLELTGKVCGKDYYAYIVAEDINGEKATDYASTPCAISISWKAPTVNTITIGTTAIINPAMPANTGSAWTGNYVYFGSYDADKDGKISSSEYVKYRVLDPETTVFSADKATKTMLLDCDNVLWNAAFKADSNLDAGASNLNEWKYSDIYKSLNTNSDSFLQTSFSALEQAAIANSTKSAAATGDGKGGVYNSSNNNVTPTEGIDNNEVTCLPYAELTGEKIFLLDAAETSNVNYGYSNTYIYNYNPNNAENREKNSLGGFDAYWWLRSPSANGHNYAGYVDSGGSIDDISDGYVNNSNIGVSPALNIDLSKVLFSSATGTDKTAVLSSGSSKVGTAQVTAWKLTLTDDGKTVGLSTGCHAYKDENGTITVPYTYSDTATTDTEKVNQISVMITDAAYDSTLTDAKILYYGKLDTGKTLSTEGSSGTFSLPSALNGKTLGEDYHVYLLAEHTTNTMATDYASKPVEIVSIKEHQVSRIELPTIPSSFTGTYTSSDVLSKKNSELGKIATIYLEDGTTTVKVPISWSIEGGSYNATAGAENTFRWTIAPDSLDEYGIATTVKTSGTVKIKNKADDSSSGGNSGSTGGTTGGGGSTGGNSGTSGGNTGDTTGGVTGNIDTTTGGGAGGTTGGTTGGNSGNTGNKPDGKKPGTTDDKNDKNKDDKNKDDKNNGKNDKNGSDGNTAGENGNGNNGGNAGGTTGGNGGNTSGSGNGNSGSTSSGSGNGSGNGNGSGTIVDTKDIPTETKTQIASAVEKVQKLDSNIKIGGYVKSDSEDISFAIPEDILKDGRSYYLVTADEDGNAKILQNESTEDGMFSATGEADTTYQIIYEEGVPLASMISEDGTLKDDTDAANCYWHWGILAVTLAGVALALFLGKKSKKYFMIVALVTTAINAAFVVGGSCMLDKIFLPCEVVLMLLVYAFFLRRNEKTQEV